MLVFDKIRSNNTHSVLVYSCIRDILIMLLKYSGILSKRTRFQTYNITFICLYEWAGMILVVVDGGTHDCDQIGARRGNRCLRWNVWLFSCYYIWKEFTIIYYFFITTMWFYCLCFLHNVNFTAKYLKREMSSAQLDDVISKIAACCSNKHFLVTRPVSFKQNVISLNFRRVFLNDTVTYFFLAILLVNL